MSIEAGPHGGSKPRGTQSDGAGPSTGWIRALLPIRFLKLRALWPWLLLAGITAFGWHELSRIDIRAVRTVLRGTGVDLLLALLGATALNLAFAGLYDVVALGALRRSPRAAARWSTGVVSFAWSNFLTIGPLAGPALRLWLYRSLNIETERARAAMAAILVSFSLALCAWCGALTLPLPAPLDVPWVRVGLVFPFAALAAFVLSRLTKLRAAPEALRQWDGSPVALMLAGVADWLLAWVVFHLALSGLHGGIEARVSLRAFFLGQLIGLASFIPGGLGTADAFWVFTLGATAGGHDRVVAALILYRCVYYVLPWAMATLVLAGRLVRAGRRMSAIIRAGAATYSVLCGVVLLTSGATPALADRMAFLARSVPLALIELSHGVSVVLGFLLLVISRGLGRGYRSSHRLALALTLSGALTTFLKGLDFEEGLFSLAAAAMLMIFHRSFEREGKLHPPVEFVVSAGVFAVVLFTAIGLGSEPIPGLGAIFGEFGYLAHGPRFVRALLLLVSLSSIVALHFALRSAERDPLPSASDIDRAVADALTFARSTNALLVAGGDKAIFRPERMVGQGNRGAISFERGKPSSHASSHRERSLSGAQEGYIAYRTAGRFLVAYSDPVCPAGAQRDLLAAFLDHADALDREVILYQITPALIAVAHDFGFNFFKLGEEAVVDLTRFDLKGNKAKTWRHAINSAEKAGASFEIVPAEALAPFLAELERVSAAWLADKHISEMRFSIGRFDAAYLKRFPCALVRNMQGNIVGFANVLEGPRGEELSVDLMRYRSAPDVDRSLPVNTMDYLFIKLMLHGKDRGFTRFNLGMAPLSAVGEERGARPVEKLAHLYARIGRHWYNYEGLRRFKEKFDPCWEPRYMAYPRPWDWPLAIASTASLITGGWRAFLFPKGEAQ